MKFRNKKTGVVLEPKSNFVEEQISKSDLYEEMKENTKRKKEE